jgi:DnaJ-class molecular chaperone
MINIKIPMDLENQCWNCEGTGAEPKGHRQGAACEFCDGVGYIRTDFGNAVLVFMQRHGGQK